VLVAPQPGPQNKRGRMQDENTKTKQRRSGARQ
jgi:hypothetical protein